MTLPDTPVTARDFGAAAWGADLHRAAAYLTLFVGARAASGDHDAAGALPVPSRSLRAFPLIGALLGLGAGLGFWISASIGLSALVAGLVAVGLLMGFTGARSERHFAHAFDALLNSGDVDQRRALLGRDTPGVAGLAALIFGIALRAAALASMTGSGTAVGALLAATAASRAALPVFAMWRLPGGVGGGPTDGASGGDTVLVAVLLGVILAVLFPGLIAGGLALVVGLAAFYAVALAATRRLGTLDEVSLGAGQQAMEILMLIVFATLV